MARLRRIEKARLHAVPEVMQPATLGPKGLDRVTVTAEEEGLEAAAVRREPFLRNRAGLLKQFVHLLLADSVKASLRLPALVTFLPLLPTLVLLVRVPESRGVDID